jgi:peptidoglycan hydrolase-like protein with peptidoglycan-binding domain
MTSVIQSFNPYRKPILTVKKGSKGNGVRWVQWQLNKRFGYNIDIDGSFGDQTDEVVRAFQRQFGLEDDGRVGPKTKEVLNSK